jgi:DNA repair exonuclease SbcCD ATPase subunit
MSEGNGEQEEAKPEIEDKLKRLSILEQVYGRAAGIVKSLKDLEPEDKALVYGIVSRVIPEKEEQIQRVDRPEAEKAEVKEDVEEVKERIEGVEERIEGVEGKVSEVDAKISEIGRKISGYEAALTKVAESLEKHASATSAIVSLTSEIQKVRDEIEKVKKELEEERRRKLEDSIPSIEEVDEHGRIVRKYEPHPRVKVLEKQTDFTYKTLGPTLIDELRQARSEISSNINRLISIFESAIAPEIRKRAPHLVEDMQERFRRLVGGMSEEERRKVLEEIESKLKGPEPKPEERKT